MLTHNLIAPLCTVALIFARLHGSVLNLMGVARLL